jgi:hypothetical protein
MVEAVLVTAAGRINSPESRERTVFYTNFICENLRCSILFRQIFRETIRA